MSHLSQLGGFLAAPNIDGYRYQSLIGSGGYADVYLYEQQWPKRLVAVKVLKSEVSDPRELFHEANIVASLRHPSIIDIYHSGVADGRGYLIMPYYSAPTLNHRVRGTRWWRMCCRWESSWPGRWRRPIITG